MCWLRIDNRDTYSTGGQASSGDVDGELDVGTFGTGLQERREPGGVVGRVEAEGCWHQTQRLWADRSGSTLLSPIVPTPPELGWYRLPTPRAPSAALNVLFDDDAAVSEERTGQRLQESPGVGAGVEGLHVAQGRALAADDASCGVDLPVQDNSAAQTTQVWWSWVRLRSLHSQRLVPLV